MSLNWPQLVAQGRAKDIGIPWSEEELHARFQLKIPAEYVREGVLTTEEYEKRKGKGGVTVIDRRHLEAKAKELGIDFAPEASDSALEKAIKKAEEKASKTKTK